MNFLDPQTALNMIELIGSTPPPEITRLKEEIEGRIRVLALRESITVF